MYGGDFNEEEFEAGFGLSCVVLDEYWWDIYDFDADSLEECYLYASEYVTEQYEGGMYYAECFHAKEFSDGSVSCYNTYRSGCGEDAREEADDESGVTNYAWQWNLDTPLDFGEEIDYSDCPDAAKMLASSAFAAVALMIAQI